MATTFTADSLPLAVRSLFEANNYTVTGPLQVHGAEVDLRAVSRTDPFAAPLYIECTVEYVDNTKYGKDATKFLVLRETDLSAKCLIVSSTGFTVAVAERALASRIDLLTYDELFNKFQQFGPYVRAVLEAGDVAAELQSLSSVYEEPFFEDVIGKDKATEYLATWRDSDDPAKKWLIIVGEYGTGKTALTKVLLHRWMHDYRMNPRSPIPIRLELRDFTRQFDARSLLHHFLDKHGLEYLSVEFVFTLIKSGRVILLLDGYDEMAQYMHVRERRACLEALADLAADGAKGILTSRPNYFSESEEFHVAEILYNRLNSEKRSLLVRSADIVERERRLDQLLQSQFLERFERQLRDLDATQTEALVIRALSDNTAAAEVVLNILRRVFRQQGDGGTRSLSGKPVIVAYLVELAEELKAVGGDGTDKLTEWQVYELIVDKLMIRDFHRSSELQPTDRLAALERLAVWLTQRKEFPAIDEESFRALVESQFHTSLRRYPSESRIERTEQLFADIRSSSTLTRSEIGKSAGWRFSHNSIREFLVAQFLLGRLHSEKAVKEDLAVSDAMRLFVASLTRESLSTHAERLAAKWHARLSGDRLGQMFALLWDGLLFTNRDKEDPARFVVQQIAGEGLAMDGLVITRLALSVAERPSNLSGVRFTESTLGDVSFIRADCRKSDFRQAILDGVTFREADLGGAAFGGALLIDVDMSDANVQGADFRAVDEISIIVEKNRYEGIKALGYLAFGGAATGEIPAFAKYQFHPGFEVVEKISRKLLEGGLRQRLGLTKKGAARLDTALASAYLELLLSENFVEVPRGRPTLVVITDVGRHVLARLVTGTDMPMAIQEFFNNQ